MSILDDRFLFMWASTDTSKEDTDKKMNEFDSKFEK